MCFLLRCYVTNTLSQGDSQKWECWSCFALITATHQFLMFLFSPPQSPSSSFPHCTSCLSFFCHHTAMKNDIMFLLPKSYICFCGIVLCKTASSVMRLHVIQLWVIISFFLTLSELLFCCCLNSKLRSDHGRRVEEGSECNEYQIY